MQQVNLYVDDLKPKTDLLSAELSALSVVAVIVTIALITVIDQSNFNQYELDVAALEEKGKSLKADADQLKNMPTANIKGELEQEIEHVRRSVKNRQQIEALFSGENMGNKRGFSPFLFEMGAAIPAGVSIDEFSITKSGDFASITGISKDAKSIPAFINRLQNKNTYKNTLFGSLVIHKSAGINKFHIGPSAAPDLKMVLQ